MLFFQFALRAEERGDFLQAIIYYEQSIAQQEGQMDAFLNLAFLYWVIDYDYGFQTHFLQTHQLEEAAVSSYHMQWPRVLASARALFPTEPEPLFWQHYFTEEATYAEHSDPFLLEEMLARWPGFCLACFYRYLHGYKGQAEREASLVLYQWVSGKKTKKSEWIASLVISLWHVDFHV